MFYGNNYQDSREETILYAAISFLRHHLRPALGNISYYESPPLKIVPSIILLCCAHLSIMISCLFFLQATLLTPSCLRHLRLGRQFPSPLQLSSLLLIQYPQSVQHHDLSRNHLIYGLFSISLTPFKLILFVLILINDMLK